jgi:peroxiredoxin
VYHLGNSSAKPQGLFMDDQPIQPGTPAPDFELRASIGPDPLNLSDLRGKIVVLAFYVLDFTST